MGRGVLVSERCNCTMTAPFSTTGEEKEPVGSERFASSDSAAKNRPAAAAAQSSTVDGMPSATLQPGFSTPRPFAYALAADRSWIDIQLRELFSHQHSSANGPVQEAMHYAVLGPAQRIRPIMALRVARLLEAPVEATTRAALALELLHCASLIVDDLPCMDDSPLRRGQASVHVKFGEATAVLAAFGLVALAARTLVESASAADACMVQFQIALLRSLDCSGLIAGQALDLRFTEGIRASSVVISELKTVPLFLLAVAAGSFAVDLPANERALLNGFGREFGLAFQMTDDVLDGEPADRTLLREKLTTLRATLAPFGPAGRDLEELVDYLHARVAAHYA